MKNFQIILSVVMALLAVPVVAQLKLSAAVASKPMAMQSASALVNKTYEGESTVTYEKSKSSLDRPIAEMIRGYDKKITISYQIASVNALEWIAVRNRAADLLDNHFWSLLAAGLFPAVSSLADDDFVPLSAYAPLTLKLNFNYVSKTRAYYHNPEDFAQTNTAAPLQTKTMLIKK
jgi:hypothetical protein